MNGTLGFDMKRTVVSKEGVFPVKRYIIRQVQKDIIRFPSNGVYTDNDTRSGV
jgi:hypothetical protein